MVLLRQFDASCPVREQRIGVHLEIYVILKYSELIK